MAESGNKLSNTLGEIARNIEKTKQALSGLDKILESSRIIKYENSLYDLQMRMQKSSKEMKKLKTSFIELEGAGKYTREEFAGMANELSEFSTVIGSSAGSMKGWLDNLQKKFPLAAGKALAQIKNLRSEFRALANDMAKGKVSGKDVATRMIAGGDFSSDSIFKAADSMDLGYGGSEKQAPLAMKAKKAEVARSKQQMEYAEKMRGVSETYYDATESYAKTTKSLGIAVEKFGQVGALISGVSLMEKLLTQKGGGGGLLGGEGGGKGTPVFVTNWPGKNISNAKNSLVQNKAIQQSGKKLASRFTKLAGAAAIAIGAMVALAKAGDLHAQEMKAQQKAIDDKQLHKRAKKAGVAPSKQRAYEKEIEDIRAGKDSASQTRKDAERLKALKDKGEGREKTANELTTGEALKHGYVNNYLSTMNTTSGGLIETGANAALHASQWAGFNKDKKDVDLDKRSASHVGRSPEEEAEYEKLLLEAKKKKAEAEKKAVMVLGSQVKIIEAQLGTYQTMDALLQSRSSHLDAMQASSFIQVGVITKQLDVAKSTLKVDQDRAKKQSEFTDEANALLEKEIAVHKAKGETVDQHLKEAQVIDNNNKRLQTKIRLQESGQRIQQLEIQAVQKLYQGKKELIDIEQDRIAALEAIAKATYMAPGAQVELRMRSIEQEKQNMDGLVAKRDQYNQLMSKSTGKKQAEYALLIKKANLGIVQSQAKIAEGADHIRRTWMETFSAQMMGADSGTYLMGGASQLSGMQEKGAAFRPFDDANRGGGHGTYKDIMKPFGGVLAEQRTVAERDIARNAGSGAGVIVEGALKAFSDRVAGALKGVSLGVYGQ